MHNLKGNINTDLIISQQQYIIVLNNAAIIHAVSTPIQHIEA